MIETSRHYCPQQAQREPYEAPECAMPIYTITLEKQDATNQLYLSR